MGITIPMKRSGLCKTTRSTFRKNRGRKLSPRCELRAPATATLLSVPGLPDKDTHHTTKRKCNTNNQWQVLHHTENTTALQVPKNNHKQCQPQIPTQKKYSEHSISHHYLVRRRKVILEYSVRHHYYHSVNLRMSLW